MRSFILALAFGLFAFSGYAKTDKIPRKIQRSIPLLTQHLTQDLDSKKAKVIAIYEWITTNIDYDYDQIQSDDYFTGVDPKAVLRSKKAICNGYVELMKAMLDEIDIKNETVSGYIHNEYWIAGQLVLTNTHAWIAFEINGTWHLADPTWDAGYIGRLRTNKKPYKPKWYLIKHFNNSKIEANVQARRAEREENRIEAHDKKPEFKDEIGFVRDAKKKYLFTESDTFLLNHLPVLPFWQLRKAYISIENFTLPTDSLKLLLENPEQLSTIDYNQAIKRYMQKDFLHQLILTGEEGWDFNPYNPGIKTLNYYNFLVLVQNKKLQKLARGSIYELTPSKYPDLLEKNDTVIKYVKHYKQFIATDYRTSIKPHDKAEFKSSQAKGKANNKQIRKIETENNKLVNFVKTSTQKTKANLKTIAIEQEKITNKYPNIERFYDKKRIGKSYTKHALYDSLNLQYLALTTLDSLLDTLRNNTSYNRLLTDINYLDYLLINNDNLIKYNSHNNNETIDYVDSLVGVTSQYVLMLYSDSLRFEVFQKELTEAVKKSKRFLAIAKTTLKDKPEVFEQLQFKYYAILKLAENINHKNNQFAIAVLNALKGNKDIKNLSITAAKQDKLRIAKNKFITTQSATNYERDMKLVKKISSDAKKWKKAFTQKIKANQ